jgi:plasmid stabilization system protein ParE
VKIRLLDLAERDLADGARFYEAQQPGLGGYFLDALFSDIDALVLYAGVHVKKSGQHRTLSHRFPYAIYYLLLDSRRRGSRLRCARLPPRPKVDRETPRARLKPRGREPSRQRASGILRLCFRRPETQSTNNKTRPVPARPASLQSGPTDIHQAEIPGIE